MAMKRTLPSLWRSAMAMTVKAIGEGYIYVFRFFHIADLNRVMDMCPQSFNGQVILLESVTGYRHPSLVRLFHIYIWLEIHNLQEGFYTERVAQRVGSEVGQVVQIDQVSLKNQEQGYVRVRVKMDVRRPICKGFSLRKEELRVSLQTLNRVC